MSPPAPLRRILGVLRQRTYGAYTAGNALSLIGTWMQRIAVGWLAWELTGSATWLGAVAFADLFPTVLVAPLAGAAADRWDRRRILGVTLLVNLAQAVLLTVLAAAGRLDIWTLLGAILVSGIATGIGQPARLALVASWCGAMTCPPPLPSTPSSSTSPGSSARRWPACC